jgi:hypothetical protein
VFEFAEEVAGRVEHAVVAESVNVFGHVKPESGDNGSDAEARNAGSGGFAGWRSQ